MFQINAQAIVIGGLSIRWYGIMIALGMFLGLMLMSAREKKLGLVKDTSINLVLWVIPASIVCARLYFVAFRLSDYIESPLSIFNLRAGGMAIYGGILGGIAAGALYCRIKHARFWVLADLVAPALALGQAVGRWGNFFNQEAYGPMVGRAELAFFPLAVYISARERWFYATFFYEFLWCALLCVAICILEKRGRLSRPGDAACFYVFGYAAERVAVEGLRADSLYLGQIRVSQALSALALVTMAVLLARSVRAPAIRRSLTLIACALSLPVLLSAFGVYSLGFFWMAVLALCQFILCALCFYLPSRAQESDFRLRK